MTPTEKIVRNRVLTVEQVITLTWAMPINRSKDVFGLSGPGLAKKLKSYGISTPPKGYYRRVEVGFTTFDYPRYEPEFLAGQLAVPVADNALLDHILNSPQFTALAGKFDASKPHWLRPLERGELYSLIWSMPVKKLAAVLLIAEGEILAACEEHNIPVPTSRDWGQHTKGYKFPIIEMKGRASTKTLMIPKSIDVVSLIDLTITGSPRGQPKEFDLSADAMSLVLEWDEAGDQKVGRSAPANLIEGLYAMGVAKSTRRQILDFLGELPPTTTLRRHLMDKVASGTEGYAASALKSLAAYLQDVIHERKKPEFPQMRETRSLQSDDARKAEAGLTFMIWMRALWDDADWRERRDLAAFELMVNHGVGVSEALSINLDGCRLLQRSVVIHPGDERERIVKIDDICILALSRYGAVRPRVDSNALFLSANRPDRLTADGLGWRFAMYLERAGMQPTLQLRSLGALTIRP